MTPAFGKLLRLVPAAALALAIAGCELLDGVSPGGMNGSAQLALSFSSAEANVASVTVEVTGPGIATPIVRNITFVGDTARDTISVPAGSARVFTITAFDAQNVATHRGTTTITVVAGTNLPLTVTLEPLVGSVPIVVTIGSFGVTISPTTHTMAVGDSLQFTAVVRDVNNNVIANPPITWGSSNGSVASVNASGKARALYPGTTRIVVNYRGYAAQSNVTVTP